MWTHRSQSPSHAVHIALRSAWNDPCTLAASKLPLPFWCWYKISLKLPAHNQGRRTRGRWLSPCSRAWWRARYMNSDLFEDVRDECSTMTFWCLGLFGRMVCMKYVRSVSSIDNCRVSCFHSDWVEPQLPRNLMSKGNREYKMFI